ncbi:SdrD B-like domain-containing protein [Alloscardovia omnicolens]|uniref:mucin-binding protein n=1 Tax=Alloscardovia omnicolens TaxID=419015 RepID=UPI003A7724C1
MSTKPAILAGTPDEPKLDVKSGEGIEPLASFDVSGATLDYQNPYFELRLSGKDAATKALINKPSFTESKSKGVDTQIGEDENGWYVRYTVAQLKGGQFIEFPGPFSFKNGVTPDGTQATLSWKFFSPDGKEIQSKELTFTAHATSGFKVAKRVVSAKGYQNNIEIDGKSTTLIPVGAVLHETPVKTTTDMGQLDENGEAKKRAPVKVSYQIRAQHQETEGASSGLGQYIPSPLKFVDIVPEGATPTDATLKKGWQWDEATRTLTKSGVVATPASGTPSDDEKNWCAGSFCETVELQFDNAPILKDGKATEAPNNPAGENAQRAVYENTGKVYSADNDEKPIGTATADVAFFATSFSAGGSSNWQVSKKSASQTSIGRGYQQTGGHTFTEGNGASASVVSKDGKIYYKGVEQDQSDKNTTIQRWQVTMSQRNDQQQLDGSYKTANKPTFMQKLVDNGMSQDMYYRTFEILDNQFLSTANVNGRAGLDFAVKPYTEDQIRERFNTTPNTLVGIAADGSETVIAENLKTGSNTFINDTARKYSSIELRFGQRPGASGTGLEMDNFAIITMVGGGLTQAAIEKYKDGTYDLPQPYNNAADLFAQNPGEANPTQASKSGHLNVAASWTPVWVMPADPSLKQTTSGNTTSVYTPKPCEATAENLGKPECTNLKELSVSTAPAGHWVSDPGAKNLKQIVLLPAGIEYAGTTSTTKNSSATDNPIEPTVIKNYKGTGKTALIYDFGDVNTAAGDASKATQQAKFLVNVTEDTNPGANVVETYAVWDNNASDPSADVPASAEGGRAVADNLDIDEDGNTSEKVEKNEMTITYGMPLELNTNKKVSLDKKVWSRHAPTGDIGAPVYYQLNINHDGFTPVTHFTMLDVFPWAKDHRVVANQDGVYTPREWTDSEGNKHEHSAFATPLTGPIESITSDGKDVADRFDVFYSTTEQGEDLDSVLNAQWIPAADTASWSKADWKKVTALKVVLKDGQKIVNSEHISVVTPHEIAYDDATKSVDTGSMAVNSVVTTRDNENYLEANEVTVDFDRYTVDGVAFRDNDENGTLGEGDIRLPHVKAVLVDAKTGEVATLPDGTPLTTTTDENGNYHFDVYTRGNYKVRFEKPNAGDTFTKPGKDTAKDAVNSEIAACSADEKGADADASKCSEDANTYGFSTEFPLNPATNHAVRNGGIISSAQYSTVKFEDVTDPDNPVQLGDVDYLSGASGKKAQVDGKDYTTKDRIAELLKQGYKLVEDPVPADGITFDKKDDDSAIKTSQDYVVKLKKIVSTITPGDPSDPKDTPKNIDDPDNPQPVKPGEPIDPNNPDGPKYPTEGLSRDDLVKQVTRTIEYECEGTADDCRAFKKPADKTETVTWVRDAQLDQATGKITYGEWKIWKDKKNTADVNQDGKWESVDSPIVPGYLAKQKTVTSDQEADGDKLNADKAKNGAEYPVVVKYTPLGKYVPEVPEGVEPLDPISYPNDPKDPTKPGNPSDPKDPSKPVGPDNPPTVTIPDVPGYTPVVPKDPTNPDGDKEPLKPVDPNDPSKGYVPPTFPEDPSKDTPITYVKTQHSSITYWDVTDPDNPVAIKIDGKAIADYVSGVAGQASDYDTAQRIAELKKLGYNLVEDGVPSQDGKSHIVFDDKDDKSKEDNSQPYKVTFTRTTPVQVDPNDPLNPEKPAVNVPDPKDPTNTTPVKPGEPIYPDTPGGPKWPDKGVSRSDLVKQVTRTIEYQCDGTAEECKNFVAPAGVEETVTWTRKALVDRTTGKVTYTDWEILKSDKNTADVNQDGKWESVKSPVVSGYVVDQKEVSSEKEADGDKLNADKAKDGAKYPVIVKYKPLGKYVPIIPDGVQKPEGSDPVQYPNDPEDPTKPGKPTNVIPHVPGHAPTVDGQPLTPVDPQDPTKGYNPPALPEDPSEDTEIRYVPVNNGQQAKIIYWVEDAQGHRSAVPGVPAEVLYGKTGDPINYSTEKIIAQLKEKGYELVTDEFASAPDDAKKYDNVPDLAGRNPSQVFNVVVRPKLVPVNPGDNPQPGQPIDPKNPNGPKWPESVRDLKLTEEVKRTVSYINLDKNGDPLEGTTTIEKKVEFTRTAQVDPISGKITYSEWKAKDGSTLPGSELPTDLPDGLKAVAATRDGNVIQPEDTQNPIPVNAEDLDIVEIVAYSSSTDPVQIAKIVYRDEEGNQVAPSGSAFGKEGDPITHDTSKTIEELKKRGYEVVTNGFDDSKKTFDDKNDVPGGEPSQVFEIVVKPGQSVITPNPNDPQNPLPNPNEPSQPAKPGDPIDPKNPDGPKWPGYGIGETDLVRTVTRTITYVCAPDDAKCDKFAKPQTVKQVVTYVRTATVNHVTGEVTHGPWTPVAVNGQDGTPGTWSMVKTPGVDGFIPGFDSVEAYTVNPDVDGDVNIEIAYRSMPDPVKPHEESKPVKTDQKTPTKKKAALARTGSSVIALAWLVALCTILGFVVLKRRHQ